MHDSSHEAIPIKSSSKYSDMVIYKNPLYDDLPPIQFNNKPFSTDDYAMLDDVLDDFISPKTSLNDLTTSMPKIFINMINMNVYEHNFHTPNKPMIFVYGASFSQASQPLNKPLFVVQGGYSNDTFYTPNKLIIIVQGGYTAKSPYEYVE